MALGLRGRKGTKQHNRAGRIGAKVLQQTEDSLEFVLDCLAARMTRSRIIRAYALAVETRARQMAEHAANPANVARPVPLRPLSNGAIDDLIGSAKERMIESVLPEKAAEARALLAGYLRRIQQTMAVPTKQGERVTPQQANAGTYAAIAEARVTGLMRDPQPGALGAGRGTISADDIARSIRQLERDDGEVEGPPGR